MNDVRKMRVFKETVVCTEFLRPLSKGRVSANGMPFAERVFSSKKQVSKNPHSAQRAQSSPLCSLTSFGKGVKGTPQNALFCGEKAEPAMKASVYRLCRQTTNKPEGTRKIL